MVGDIARIGVHPVDDAGEESRPLSSSSLGDVGDGGNVSHVNYVVGREVLEVDCIVL